MSLFKIKTKYGTFSTPTELASFYKISPADIKEYIQSLNIVIDIDLPWEPLYKIKEDNKKEAKESKLATKIAKAESTRIRAHQRQEMKSALAVEKTRVKMEVGKKESRFELEDQDFLEIPGYVEYFANKDGRIASIRQSKVKYLSQSVNNAGYMQVGISLWTEGNQWTGAAPVHRLVALAFLPTPNNPDANEINHKDENKLNNTIGNLEWMTRRENLEYSDAAGNFGHGTVKCHTPMGIFGSYNSAAIPNKVTVSTVRNRVLHPDFPDWYIVDDNTPQLPLT